MEPRDQPDVSQEDVYGSPLAPVGTSAPVPEDILKQLGNSVDSFDTFDDQDLAAAPVVGDAPEGELVSAIEEDIIDEIVEEIQKDLDDPEKVTDFLKWIKLKFDRYVYETIT